MFIRSQSFTFGAFKETVLKLLERYSSNGTENTCGEVKDIENRLVRSINIHQRQLFADFCPVIKKQKCVFLYPEFSYSIDNIQLCKDEYHNEVITEKNPAIRIECSGEGTIRVVYDDTADSYRVNTKTGELDTICISVNPLHDNKVLLEFQAGAQLFINSIDIFENFYGTSEESEWFCRKGRCTLKLPEDFGSIICIRDKDGKEVSQEVFDISHGEGVFSTDKENAGTYFLEYYSYPEEICEGADDSTELNLPAALFDALCYMCAADVCPSCDGEMYSKLTYKYREILENFYDKKRQLSCGRNRFFALYGRIQPRGRKIR